MDGARRKTLILVVIIDVLKLANELVAEGPNSVDIVLRDVSSRTEDEYLT